LVGFFYLVGFFWWVFLFPRAVVAWYGRSVMQLS